MGMFSKVIFEVGEEIEPIKGREVSGAAECLHGGRYAVDVEEYQGGPRMCVDMGEENSCYTRFANDSLNDDEDNCRPVLINGKPYLIALVKIYPGDELTYSYDYEYWEVNYECLSKSARQALNKKRKITKARLRSKWRPTPYTAMEDGKG